MYSFCFVKEDKVLLLKLSDPAEESQELYNLKCPPRVIPEGASNLKRVEEYYIVTASVSSYCNYVSACDSNNLLHLWKYDSKSWSHVSARPLVRKCQKIIFTNAESDVIVADRGGDVYVFSISNDGEGKFLLGHISLIIDIAISRSDKYLLTCDRDGKIRVSCYPNCYNIYCYCLGHQEFVSSVQSIQLSEELILSGSGDGTIKLWDFNGDNISTVNIFENNILCENLKLYGIPNKLCNENGKNQKASLPCLLDEKQAICAVKAIRYFPQNNLCAVAFYSIKGIALYRISHSKDEYFDFIKFIPVDCIPFDVMFDSKGNIIILQKSSEKQYIYYKLVDEDTLDFQHVNSNSICIAENIQKLCGNIQNLKEVQQDDFETLFKRNFDDKNDVNDEPKNKMIREDKDSFVNV